MLIKDRNTRHDAKIYLTLRKQVVGDNMCVCGGGDHTRHVTTRVGDKLMHALLVVATGIAATAQRDRVELTTRLSAQQF